MPINKNIIFVLSYTWSCVHVGPILELQLCNNCAWMYPVAYSARPYCIVTHASTCLSYEPTISASNVVYAQSDASVVDYLGLPLDVTSVEEHNETFAPWKRLVLQLHGPKGCTHVSS